MRKQKMRREHSDDTDLPESMTYVEFPGNTNRPRIYKPTVTERVAVTYWKLKDDGIWLLYVSCVLSFTIILTIVTYLVY